MKGDRSIRGDDPPDRLKLHRAGAGLPLASSMTGQAGQLGELAAQAMFIARLARMANQLAAGSVF